MAEVVTDFVERRLDQLVEEAITNCFHRLMAEGLDSEMACAILDNAVEMIMAEDEEWTHLEAIDFYDSIHASVEDDEIHVVVGLEEGANDNVN